MFLAAYAPVSAGAPVVHGTIVDADGGAPLVANVIIWKTDEPWTVQYFESTADGTYSVGENLPTGSYTLSITRGGYYDEGATFDVPAPIQGHKIDFALVRWGTVSGRILDAVTGLPIAGATLAVQPIARIEIVGTDGAWSISYPFDVNQGYWFIGLADGYSGQDPSCNNCLGVTPIYVGKGQKISGLEIRMLRGGRIRGRVTNHGTPAIAGLGLYDREYRSFGSTTSGPDGVYTFENLRAQDYFVRVDGGDYLKQLYDGIPCEPSCDPRTGTAITVTPGATVDGVDFDVVSRYAELSGRVADASTGLGIPDAILVMTSIDGSSPVAVSTDASGRYRFATTTNANGVTTGLAAGRYWLRVAGPEGYGEQIWPGEPCRSTCSSDRATIIDLAPEAKLDGLDFSLSTFFIRDVYPSDGPARGGTPITVEGHDFTSDTVLMVGDSQAEILNADATSIQALTPDGSVGPADVSVARGNRRSKLREAFLYLPNRFADPFLVADINHVVPDDTSLFREIAVVGNLVFFTEDDGKRGRELWRTDETAQGTWLVRDIVPGPVGSNPTQLTPYGNKLCFVVQEEVGRSIWESDGSAAGTRRLAGPFLDILSLQSISGRLYVFGVDDGGARQGLWSLTSDQGSSPSFLGRFYGVTPIVEFRSKLYFGGLASSGDGLWTTNGTPGGTKRTAPVSITSDLVAAQDAMYFGADSDEGVELWRSDGTSSGTALLADVEPARMNGTPKSSNPEPLTSLGALVFFRAVVNGHVGLWVSDGTTTGTRLLVELDPGDRAIALGNRVYFVTDDGTHGRELWTSDGTLAGTSLFVDIRTDGGSDPAWLTRFGNMLFFAAADDLAEPHCISACHGELWKTDGSVAGTAKVREINPGPRGSSPTRLTVGPDSVYFFADDGLHGCEVWGSNGTETGTRPIAYPASAERLGNSSNPRSFTALNQSIAFFASDGEHGTELWTSDGKRRGTSMVRDIRTDPSIASVSDQATLTGFHGKVYFVADDTGWTPRWWTSDGTDEGTRVLESAVAKTYSSAVVLGDRLSYVVSVESSDELRSTSGDGDPTTLARRPQIGSVVSSGSALFFFAGENQMNELWRSDGTAEGTTLVRSFASGPGALQGVDGNVWFVEGYTGPLWRSDGTPDGTIQIVPSGAAKIVAAGGWVYFTRLEGNGVTLWRTRATGEETQRVMSLPATDTSSGRGYSFVAVDEILFFVGADGGGGFGLWRTDGTTEGTRLVTTPTHEPRSPFGLSRVGKRLFFTFSRDLVPGIWTSDGTAEGTGPIAEGLSGEEFTLGGRLIYFRGSEDTNDWELWAIPVEALSRRHAVRR